jgi:AraC-like DNA-binding protein
MIQAHAGELTRPTAIHTERLDDCDRVALLHSGENLRIEQLSPGCFEGTFAAVRGRIVRAATAEFNQVVLIRGQAMSDQVSIYPVSPENAGGVWQGRRLDPGRLVIHGPDAGTDHRSSRYCRLMEFSLPADALVHFARILLRADINVGPRSWSAASPSPEVVAALVRSTRRMLALGAGVIPSDAPEWFHAEQECIRTIVAAALPACGPRAADLPLSRRTALAARAEEIMRARLDRPVGTIEFCAELGVSERTLRRAFQERRGLGPIEFSKVLRLHAVRSELKTGATSVAEAARRWGFHHLGNFAADYRRAFGRLPSWTFRQSSL